MSHVECRKGFIVATNRLLFIGYPDADEIAQWSALREFAPQRGWTPTRTFAPGETVWAVAAGSVLERSGSAEARVVASVRDANIPCTTATDAIAHAYTTVRRTT